jgi:uncharacterized protein with HEPN domain
MVDRDPRAYLHDILESCDRILTNLGKTTFSDFQNDLTMQDAFMRRFEIIGEAVKRLPTSLRDAYPDIAWRDAAAFRDVIAHDYVDIEIDRVYRTATDYLPIFRDQIARIIANLPEQGQV